MLLAIIEIRDLNMDKNSSCCTKLSPCNLGMAIGIVSGLTLLLLAVLSMCDFGLPLVDLYGEIYLGYEASIIGAIMGFIWGFIQGFIFGALIACIYNCAARCCPCSSCKCNRSSCSK